MEDALKPAGLTLPQFSVMTMLAAYPGASGAELARLSLLTPQTMSVIVANLARLGMILRRPHAEHGRIQVIALSEAGHEVLARSKEAVRSAEAGLLADVTPKDEAIVRRWLVQIARLPL
ncbi:MarR family transcriptional regulator [Pantoea sp. Mb-10]|uniref:MarR family winged helix-turn-helix transcriptional regulator n=1 Tax=unclassified Pantoea TaxID=2630326 RepID=UPI001E4F7B7A|nr:MULTISPECIES: MarR family transcriptional regulator [unclassified Pantoea]MCE0491909.1 MarR family transcriptional regulator [Pantoea sp. Mb-10]MCE0503353.1 MarR family transcriptional regulator [Pantoea sp. Pb-8]